MKNQAMRKTSSVTIDSGKVVTYTTVYERIEGEWEWIADRIITAGLTEDEKDEAQWLIDAAIEEVLMNIN